MKVRVAGERVALIGRAVTVMRGELVYQELSSAHEAEALSRAANGRPMTFHSLSSGGIGSSCSRSLGITRAVVGGSSTA